MTEVLSGDAWLSSDEYNARARANTQVRSEATMWFLSLAPWFTANRLMVHNGLPVIAGTHWTTAEGVWLLATPLEHGGRPETEPNPDGDGLVLGLVWAPAPSDPPAGMRRMADPLPAGATPPAIRHPKANSKILRAPGWKDGLRRANVYLQERKDWWEHRSLGIDAQRARGSTNSSWLDQIRNI